jgi:hypothetical protein
MDRIRSFFAKKSESQEYAPLQADADDNDAATLTSTTEEPPFSWLEYSVFLLLGVAMLWAWYVKTRMSCLQVLTITGTCSSQQHPTS